MKIKQYVLGPVQTNCFVVYNDQNQAAIIDPGANGAQIVDAVQKDGKEITMVLLTHGHFDHIGGVHEIQEKAIVSYISMNRIRSYCKILAKIYPNCSSR